MHLRPSPCHFRFASTETAARSRVLPPARGAFFLLSSRRLTACCTPGGKHPPRRAGLISARLPVTGLRGDMATSAFNHGPVRSDWAESLKYPTSLGARFCPRQMLASPGAPPLEAALLESDAIHQIVQIRASPGVRYSPSYRSNPCANALPELSNPLRRSASIVASRRNSRHACSTRSTGQIRWLPSLPASLTNTANCRRMYLLSSASN